MRQRDPVGGHPILRTHRPHRAGIRIGAHIAHHAHRHHREQYGKRLPYFRIQPRGLDLADHNIVALTQQRQPLRRNFTENAYCQSGSRERLPL